MKRFFGFAAVAAVILSFASCQKEGGLAGSGNECVTEFTVQIPQAEVTKTVSEGENVGFVYYEIWDSKFTKRLTYGKEEIVGGVMKTNFSLVKDQTYNFIFWAQKKFSGKEMPFSWETLKQVKVDYSLFTENNKDSYDAFYAVAEVLADGKEKKVLLYRPFAQLNFGASTMTTSVGDFTIQQQKVTVSGVSTVFNTVSGAASTDAAAISTVTFDAPKGGLVQAESTDKKDLKVGGNGYFWVSMNYFLVPGDKQANVEVKAKFVTSGGTVEHSVPSVPVEKNFRTNIVGDIFTSSSDFIIEVVPDFKGQDKDVIVE